MGKNMLLWVVVLAVVAGAGYYWYTNNGAMMKKEEVMMEQEQPAAPVAEEAMMEPGLSITMTAQNESSQEGTATITDVDGKAVVKIAVAAGIAGVAQPAHIHVGACPNPGAVKYPLTNVVDGVSETTLDVSSEQLRAELPLAVNVHKSAAEAGVYVSCGDIK